MAVGILIGFAYGGLTGDEAHSHHTQEILFSIFCGLNVAIRYKLITLKQSIHEIVYSTPTHCAGVHTVCGEGAEGYCKESVQ